MSAVTLRDKLTTAAVRMGKYRGGETPASFGDPAAEFEALQHGVGLFDLAWQTKFRISGRDRTRWLNGMITNNIRDLAPGHGVYAFILTPQGHNQGDLVAYNRSDDLLATTDREQAEKITTVLKRYIIMDQVEIEDISDALVSMGLAGPRAGETLATVGIDAGQLAPGQLVDAQWNGVGIAVARGAHPQMAGYEIWLAPDQVEKLWESLVAAGAIQVGSEAIEMYRVARGVPRYGMDLRERDLPQETGQQHALNFSKGCYIGQEIVERIRARGNVHRTFIGFDVQGEPPQPGAKIRANDKDMGEVTSAVQVPANGGQRTLALGYLRREVAAPGTVVQIGGQAATVQNLPFQF